MCRKISAAPADGDQLSGDAHGDFRGGYSGNLQADWGMYPCQLFARHPLFAQFIENLVYFPLGADEPHISRGRTDHRRQRLRIVTMSPSNDHDISPRVDVES